jgi:hypothetical protein
MYMSGACRRHGKEKKFKQGLVENLNEGDRLKDLGVDGEIILKQIFNMQVWDWIHLVQNRDQW